MEKFFGYYCNECKIFIRNEECIRWIYDSDKMISSIPHCAYDNSVLEKIFETVEE